MALVFGDGSLALKVELVRHNDQGPIAKLAQELLRVGYIHRSQRVQHAHSRRWELELYNGPFEEDGLFTWVYEGSKTKLYLMCAGMLVGALGLCMIQIWPLWLKIGVWWCSVTFLTTFGVLCVVRLILFCLMFIVGFRGSKTRSFQHRRCRISSQAF